jgi:transitional endoplasmic reticulum ATPase
MGIKFRRGVLLAGVYGVGKTLGAKVAAGIAVEKGITFIYCKRAEEFAEAVEFAIQYQPAVVFCEDIDRVLAGERSVKMDDILNIVDGIDTKAAEVMIVLTSNAPEAINPAGLRPGRLDAIINVLPPDAEAVVRLIKMYGAGMLATDLDLTKVAAKLEGSIPAVIEEVVKRSKLAALKDNPDSNKIVVTELALEEAADTMEMQLALLNGPKDPIGHRGSITMKEILEPVVRETLSTVYGR